MFERPYESAEPAILNEDQRAVFQREVSDIVFGLKHIAQGAVAGLPVERNLIYNVLSLSESRLAELGKLTGVETNSKEDMESRYKMVREANERIRALEQQLGGAVTAAHTRQSIAQLSRKVRAWWRRDGLGHVSEISFDDWGNMKVTLSCYLHGNRSSFNSGTPVTDRANHQAWLDSLVARGFVVGKGHSSDQLVANDAGRAALVQFVTSALPSAKFREIAARSGRDGVNLMTDATFTLDKLEEVEALQVSVEE